MHRRRLLGVAIGTFAAVAIASAPALATPCTNLQTLALEQTTITSAADIATGVFTIPGTSPPQRLTGLPAFCRVTATLAPTVDSVIKIEVWLPETTWSGRFLGLGSGGYGGFIDYGALALRLNAGYAVANTGLGTGVAGCNSTYCGSAGNMGNPLAIAYGDPPIPTLGLFGFPERIKDYGYRAIHLMTLRGKEITTAFYQRSADKSYFFGCSTGGQNALMEAQRFPQDYDGIVAGAAAFNHTRLWAGGAYGWRRLHDHPGSFIQAGQFSLINKAVLKQCAGQDGGAATDQFLTDPRDCHFDPGVLQCTGGDVPPACLTADQVTAMRGHYAGVIDPVTGERILPGGVRGSETDDVAQLGFAFLERLPEPSSDGGMYWVFGPSFGQPGSAVNYLNFDIHRDLDAIDDQLADTLNATSTDLSEFREHGGKLIMYHGWADPVVTPLSSVNYFNALVAHDGHHFEFASHDAEIEDVRFDARGGQSPLRRTQSYTRLFMVPGMYHCANGGPGPHSFGALAALVTWVESGTAPETILATKFVNDTPPAVEMTRPLCAFPKVAKYNGSGSTDDATNFTCVTDEHDFNQTPAPQFGP
jgi:feruloyl esterase